MKRPRYPSKFKTKREILWYIKGLKDAKVININEIQEEKRYLEEILFMNFDKKKGNLIGKQQKREE